MAAARKLFSLYTVGELEGKMALVDATGVNDLTQLLSRASLLLGIHLASNTKLTASFYGPDGELHHVTDETVLATVPCGATLFIMQQNANGSPKTLTRRLSVNGRPLDAASTESLSNCPVPPCTLQMTEEQQKIYKHLEDQLHMFEQSLGSLATHPVWRSMLQRMHRCIQKCALRGGDVSEELRDLITSDGEVSPSAYAQLPSTEQLDLYAQHCLQDLLHALAALKTSALSSPPPVAPDTPATSMDATRNPSVTCGA